MAPGSNDYNTVVFYRTPGEACQSVQNSFVPYFGFSVGGLISVNASPDLPDPNSGILHPVTACVMDAGSNGTPTIYTEFGCSNGNRAAQGSCVPASYPLTAEPLCTKCRDGNAGTSDQFPLDGDPVSISSGAKTEDITDYSSGGPNPIEITRVYRSLMMPTSGIEDGMGLGWRTDIIGRQIEVHQDKYNMIVRREDGARTRFLNPNQSALSTPGPWSAYSIENTIENGADTVWGVFEAKDKFTQVTASSVYQYTDENDRVDTFNAAGFNPQNIPIYRVSQTKWKGGYQRNYSYNASGKLAQISDTYGRVVNLTWTGNAITLINLPDGTRIEYTYQKQATTDNTGTVQGTELLTQVARKKADGTLIDSTGYVYDRATTSTPLLTGVIDAKGVQIEITTYDSIGRVLTAQRAGGADGISIAYTDGAFSDSVDQRTVTNALGQVTVYNVQRPGTFVGVRGSFAVQSVNRLATTTVAAAAMSQTTDNRNFLGSKTDWNGIVTQYTNDANGNETQRVEDFNGVKRTIVTTWSATFRLSTKIVAPNLTVDMTYDTAGRLTQRKETDTSIRSGPIRIWNYTYNALGLLATVTGPRTDLVQTTTYTYDAVGNLLTVKDALNRVTAINTVNAAGQPTQITDANGIVTNMTYDPLGRVTSTTVQGPIPATTSFGYDLNGQLTTITSPTGVTLTYGYDAAHRLTSMTDGAGNKTVFVLDALGNRSQTQVQTASSQVLMANSATFDSLGRLLTSLGAANQTTSYQYDNNGNLTRITDPRSAVTQNAFDSLNRLKQTTDALNAVTKTAYDGLDNVTSVTDAKLHATTYTVNGFGFVTQAVSPDSGTTNYTYDLAGNVLSRTDARKVVTNYTYDALDRPLTRVYPSAATEKVTFVYDAVANGNKGIGRLTSLTDAAGTASFTYDTYGNRITETRTIATVTYTTGYGYDLAGKLTQMTYPSGRIVSYQRDTLGQVSGITTKANSAAAPVTLASNVSYLPFGPQKAATLGNGVQLTDSYDADYRLTGRQAVGAATLQNLTLGYDGASNITSISDGVAANLSQTYQYDLVGRVKQGTGGWGTDNYTYDALGNRLTRNLVNSATTAVTYTYTAANTRLATAVQGSTTLTYGYDANGALLTRKIGNAAQSTYTFNADARLATSGTNSYKYNTFGQRAVQTVSGGGTHFLFSPEGLLLAEHSVTGAKVRDYIYLNGQPLAVVDSAGTVNYILNDQIGQPQKMLNPSGTVTWQRVSGIFGDTVTQLTGTTAANPQRFPGQQFDPATSLHYNYYRDYDPATGRYVETDPIGLEGGMNVYAYVDGNPVNRVDLSGLRPVDVYIWPSDPGSGSVGHVMVTEHNSRTVITSQFPEAPNQGHHIAGPNTKWTFDQTARGEGRDAIKYTIQVPDDAGFDRVANAERGRRNWRPLPWNSTNCSRAAVRELNGGGVPVPRWAGLTPDNLNRYLSGMPDYVSPIVYRVHFRIQ